MRSSVAALILGAMIMSAALPAAADTYAFRRTFDTTVPATREDALAVTGLNGDVHLIADSGNTVRIHATLRARSKENLDGMSVHARRDGATIRIQDVCGAQTHILFWSFADCDIDYQILYPKDLTVNIKNDNGDVGIDGATGSVVVTNHNGDVTAHNAASTLNLSTKHGDVRAWLANAWRGRAITLQTSMGDVQLQVPSNFAATLQAHTRLGDVTDRANLHGGSITVIARTTFGDVTVSRIH
jgi:hypothetical protein